LIGLVSASLNAAGSECRGLDAEVRVEVTQERSFIVSWIPKCLRRESDLHGFRQEPMSQNTGCNGLQGCSSWEPADRDLGHYPHKRQTILTARFNLGLTRQL